MDFAIKMSRRFEITVDRILEKAHTHEKSVFQQDEMYKGFKRKKIRKENYDNIVRLVEEFKYLELYEECAFWCEKQLEIAEKHHNGDKVFVKSHYNFQETACLGLVSKRFDS